MFVNQSNKVNDTATNSVIFHLDRADLERVDKMVTRFNEGQGDNLMIIEPGMDSGPAIHDVISNGKEINWIVDNSRDAWSTDKGKTEYVCKLIRIHERDSDFIDVELSKCKNYKDDDQLRVLSFRKEKL
ncbi:DUF4362 domain-containing protein [Paenibacillus pectinilyticus]|nr:DUF4362 domain-containing protein [Paenibacillus pectinilyticus]